MNATNIILEKVQYTQLKHIDDVRPLNDSDYSALAELREVLIKHELTERFGISLLHTHYDMEAEEYLLESTDESNGISRFQVTKEKTLEEGTIDTMWKFGLKQEQAIKSICKCPKNHNG